jgi:hypothetical protein
MYTNVVRFIMSIGLINNILLALGLISALVGIVYICLFWYMLGDQNEKIPRYFWIGVISLFFTTASVVIGTSPFLKVEWIIARQVAPQIDKYVESHPESIYNPEIAIETVGNATSAVFDSIKSFPNIIERLTKGLSALPSTEERDRLEFEEWKKTKK